MVQKYAAFVRQKSKQITKAKPDPLFNKRFELISKCRHKNKFLLKKVDQILCARETSLFRINKINLPTALLSFRMSHFSASKPLPFKFNRMEVTQVLVTQDLKRNRRQTQHAYYFVNTILSTF